MNLPPLDLPRLERPPVPELPQNAANPRQRELELAKHRELYRFDYAYPPGVGVCAELPPEAQFSACMALEVARIQMEMDTNALKSGLSRPKRGRSTRFSASLERFSSIVSPGSLSRVLGAQLSALADETRSDRPVTLVDYDHLYATVERPAIADCFQEDWVFAWQRIAGANPMVLARADKARAASLGIDDATYRAVTEYHYGPGVTGAPATLADAASAGLVYVADFAFLAKADAKAGSWLGLTKYLDVPVATFVYYPPMGRFPARLMPLAIRLGQSEGSKLVAPTHGNAWLRAKTAVQVSDIIWHESRAHLGHTHLVMEAVAVSCERTMASCHPLKILLAPHYEFTMAINDFAKHHLVCPGGQVERYMATAIASFIGCAGTALADFDLLAMLPEKELESRDVRDPNGIAVYPYRDDAIPVFRAIRKFVEEYVGLYYPDDLTVLGDKELQAFRVELGAQDGGRLPRIPTIETRARLVDVMAFFLFTASAQHSAVNYTQWPFMGYVPNMPAAMYAEPSTHYILDPDQRLPATWDPLFLAMLPSYSQSMGQIGLLYLLSGIRYNHLGRFCPFYFGDLRVLPVVRRFNEELARVESDAKARDVNRPMSYPYLFPSNIARSVHI